MITREPLCSYLKSDAFLSPLGIPADTELAFSILGQGEYNLNYTFLHPVTGEKLVLRINTGSQMHLEDQIGYEFSALQALESSGRTPKPLLCCPELGILVMQWLPGIALDYNTDMDIAAGILADIHSVPIPEGCKLIRPAAPALAIYEECLEMVQHYYDWEEADPIVTELLKALVAEIGKVEDVFSRPKTEAGRRLVYPDGLPAELLPKSKVIRVAFNGGTAYQPLIASLAIDCGVKVNILGADTRNIDGKAFGTMLLGLPEDKNEAANALAYITSQDNVTVEEVPDYHA